MVKLSHKITHFKSIKDILLKNREHKNTQKWHAQNVAKCYVYSKFINAQKDGCPIENKNTKSSNLATEDESQPLSDIKQIKQNG